MENKLGIDKNYMMKTKVNIVNKKVRFEYEILRTEVAGIMLIGSEVKSIKSGKVSLSESYCTFVNGELILKNANITEMSSFYTHKSTQDRKLLLKKVELDKFKKELVKGLTIVPYRIFENERGMIKVEVVLGRGKKLHDKRETIKTRDIQKETQRNLK
jgi:SsrA-binding protein